MGFTTGTTTATALKVAAAMFEVTVIAVGTIGPIRVQLGALPVNVSWPGTATCNPLTAVLLLNVAFGAVIGPPPVRVPALSVTSAPLLIDPSVSVLPARTTGPVLFTTTVP